MLMLQAYQSCTGPSRYRNLITTLSGLEQIDLCVCSLLLVYVCTGDKLADGCSNWSIMALQWSVYANESNLRGVAMFVQTKLQNTICIKYKRCDCRVSNLPGQSKAYIQK